ncbi:MAG: hypothetical protein LBL18_06630 [Bacteroidales bacterium]|jgi:hypothetical protein|nr:hypothetical protein [Bacteroidales bacterium]
MKKCTLFSISMLLIACLGFVAADCSKCKKGDPGYPNCGDTVIPPPPPPSPTVERWTYLAAGDYDDTSPIEKWLVFYPYGYNVLELWSDGQWNVELPGSHEYYQGIYQTYPYVIHGDTIRYLDLYVVSSSRNDTVLWKGYEVSYADRNNASSPFTIPAYVVQTIDSLQLNNTVMRLQMIMPSPSSYFYEYYVKMQ